MSVLTSLIILFLAMLIQAFLQLTPAIFTLFYHSALAKTSEKKADDLSLSFILGVEVFHAIIFLSVFSIISWAISSPHFETEILNWILAGIFGALSVASFFYYFRSRGTELFIPRKIAKNLSTRAKNLKTRSDAWILGFFAGVPELLFTLPLFMICSLTALKFAGLSTPTIIILYILVATVPLFILRALFRGGLNLADIQRLRVKNKSFFRLTITLGYLFLAFLIIANGVNLL